MAQIAVNNLTFAWEGASEDVFENISFSLDSNWRVGLIGRNGRGKTTLLKLLADNLPHQGVITAPAGFKYFPYDIPDPSLETLAVIDQVCPVYEFWELCRELSLLDVDSEVLFRPFSSLSPGERTKTLMATLFLGSADFVLLDEPTNHLDIAGTQTVSEYLHSKQGFIIVSHDRSLLDSVCDHIAAIGRTGVEVISGNYSVWAEEKRRRDERELATNEKLAKDIKRLAASARTAKNWSDKTEQSKIGNGPADRGFIGHKSAKMMKRSKALEARRQNAVEQKSALLQDIDEVGELKMMPLRHHQNLLVEFNDVCINYLPELEPVTFDIEQGERIALVGKNGIGKSSILKLLALGQQPDSGTIRTAGGLIISYLPQEAPRYAGSLRDFADAAGIDLTLFLTILRNLGLPREAFTLDMADLSDGMNRKALLAKSLCTPTHLYIWDEPLNYIDIISREQIEALISEHAPTLLFVEHDETFVKHLATRTISLHLRPTSSNNDLQ